MARSQRGRANRRRPRCAPSPAVCDPFAYPSVEGHVRRRPHPGAPGCDRTRGQRRRCRRCRDVSDAKLDRGGGDVLREPRCSAPWRRRSSTFMAVEIRATSSINAGRKSMSRRQGSDIRTSSPTWNQSQSCPNSNSWLRMGRCPAAAAGSPTCSTKSPLTRPCASTQLRLRSLDGPLAQRPTRRASSIRTRPCAPRSNNSAQRLPLPTFRCSSRIPSVTPSACWARSSFRSTAGVPFTCSTCGIRRRCSI